MKKPWHGIMKVASIQHISKGKVIWEENNLYNMIHSDGEQYILETLFYNDGTKPPANYWLGLDNRVILNYSDTIADLTGEPIAGGYARQPISSSTESNSKWAIIPDTGPAQHKAVSTIVQFSSDVTGFGPCNNLFLSTDEASGVLISSVRLSNEVQISNGDYIYLRMVLSLREC